MKNPGFMARKGFDLSGFEIARIAEVLHANRRPRKVRPQPSLPRLKFQQQETVT